MVWLLGTQWGSIHGWPCHPNELALVPAFVNFRQLLREEQITPQGLRSMHGNGWHLPSIGSWVMFVLLCIEDRQLAQVRWSCRFWQPCQEPLDLEEWSDEDSLMLYSEQLMKAKKEMLYSEQLMTNHFDEIMPVDLTGACGSDSNAGESR